MTWFVNARTMSPVLNMTLARRAHDRQGNFVARTLFFLRLTSQFTLYGGGETLAASVGSVLGKIYLAHNHFLRSNILLTREC